MKLNTRFILLGHLTEAPMLGILRSSMDTGNRKTEASSGERNASCTWFNALPTLSLPLLPTVALFFIPPVHLTELELILQFLAEREFHDGWVGITAGAIRRVILEVSTLLWYSWKKESFPRRTWKGRNKPTGLLSYLLETDSHLQLHLLYYSWRTLCICLHFILFMPQTHLAFYGPMLSQALTFREPHPKGFLTDQVCYWKTSIVGCSETICTILEYEKPIFIQRGQTDYSLSAAQMIHSRTNEMSRFWQPILSQSAISRHKLTRTIWTLNSCSDYSAYSTLEMVRELQR